MSESFEIQNPKVPAFSQLSGTYKKFVSCFPTSVAMALRHCLNLVGRDKDAIGCSLNMYLEDYVNLLLNDQETEQWIKNNSIKYGNWILQYFYNNNQRQILWVEEYVFNRLMNPLGFKATGSVLLTYETLCETIEKNNLPVIICGDFSSVSKIQGHINICVGFNTIGLKEVIVNDPYGNALQGYPYREDIDKMKAEYVHYPVKFFIRDNANHIWGLIIEKI